MDAKQALELSKRKVHHVIVDAIEEAAKRGSTKVCIDSLLDGEQYYWPTSEDFAWLADNGYTVFREEDEGPFGEQDTLTYVRWGDDSERDFWKWVSPRYRLMANGNWTSRSKAKDSYTIYDLRGKFENEV